MAWSAAEERELAHFARLSRRPVLASSLDSRRFS
jgi:hypothetical protein